MTLFRRQHRKRSLAIASQTRWSIVSPFIRIPYSPYFASARSLNVPVSITKERKNETADFRTNLHTSSSFRTSTVSPSPPLPQSSLFNSSIVASIPRGKDRTPLASLLPLGSSPVFNSVTYKDWIVETIEKITDLDVHIYILRHIPTSAIYLHMDTDDIHNYFAVSFRTPVPNSHGIPHVLEHTSLCGSERYDVKDPFHCMTKRSLGTDMNAVTSADHTSYHFSTTNTQDFHNLLQVFLDATFFPKLRYIDYQQEGIRIEPEDIHNVTSTSPLIYKGVVYNEMKGYMSNASEHISRTLYATLFPRTTYAHSHGGDPKEIPFLTYTELLQFYQQHYKLSNTFFVSYGDINPLYHIDTIENFVIQRKLSQSLPETMSKIKEDVPAVSLATFRPSLTESSIDIPLRISRNDLEEFQKVDNITTVPLVRVRVPPTGANAPSLQNTEEHPENLANGSDETVEDVTPEPIHPIDDSFSASSVNDNNGNIYLRAWGTCDSNNSYHILLLRIISDLLVSGTDAPLYRLLIHYGLASHFAPGTGLDSTTVQSVLLFGAAGIQESRVDDIDNAILNAIRYSCNPTVYTQNPDYEGINDPFSPSRVCAIIHQMELALRMRNPSFGSVLANAVTEQWAHRSKNILEGLYVNKLLQRLKRDLRIPESTTQVPLTINSEFLRSILHQYTLENKHNVRIIGTPDENLPTEFTLQEQEKLRKLENEWTYDMRKQAAENAKAVVHRSRGNIDTLPGLSVSAVSRKSPVSDRVEHLFLQRAGSSLMTDERTFGVPLQVVSERSNGISTLRLLFNLQLPSDISSLTTDSSSSLSSGYHPWYEASRQQYWSRIDDYLHKWLAMFCGFTAYGTKDRSPHEWETAVRLALGGISVSIMNASPTLLPDLRSIHSYPALQGLVQPYPQPSSTNNRTIYSTPPLYGIAIETSWISDRTKDAVPLLTELLTSSAVSNGLLQTRDRSLLTQAIRSAAVENAMHLTENGASYAKLLASSSMNPLSALRELQGGMNQARLIEYIHSLGDDGITIVAQELETLTRSILAVPYGTETNTVDRINKEFTDLLSTEPVYATPGALRFPIRAMLTTDTGNPQKEGIDSIIDLVNQLPLKNLSTDAKLSGKEAVSSSPNSPSTVLRTVSTLTTETSITPDAFIPSLGYQAIINVPTTVHSLSIIVPGPPWGTDKHAYISILCSLLSSTHLHESIRERGGAYEVSSRIGSNDDIVFSTGEDPVPIESIERIKEGAQWAREGKFTVNDLDEAKLSVFAQLDAPVAPSSIGLSSYLYGVTSASRQMYRDWIFQATKEDIQNVADEYLVQRFANNKAKYNCVMAGPQELILGGGGMKRSSRTEDEWTIVNILNNEKETN